MATGVDEKKQRRFFHQQKVNLDQMISRGFCGYIAFIRGHEVFFKRRSLKVFNRKIRQKKKILNRKKSLAPGGKREK